MEQQDLLALRFPSRVPVTFQVLDPEGVRLEGSWPASGVDVSRTGVRLEAEGLPPSILKRLADPERDMMVELAFDVPTRALRALPVMGWCRWINDLGPGRWVLGVEWLKEDKSRGEAIASHFESRYTRPKVVRTALSVGGVAVLVFGVLLLLGWRHQRAAIRHADAELEAALDSKEELSSLIAALQDYLSHAPREGSATADAREQLADYQRRLDELRNEISRKTVALAEVQSGAVGEQALVFARQGDAFFADGRLSPALAAYEQAVTVDASAVQPWLKIGILYEFEGRPLRALEAYQRYLELRPDAPDKFEVTQRVDQLYQQIAELAPSDALAPPRASPNPRP